MACLPGRTLAVAGGSQEEVAVLRAHAAELGIADRTEAVGWLPPGEVDAFLARGRVGACPLPSGVDSIGDRFTSPMKLLQMMALGLPVVATDTAPVRAVATHGEEALLAPPGDPEGFAAALRLALDDQALANRIAEGGRRRAEAFSWPNRAAKLDGFVASLCSAHAP
jgi:glycosyltransferase involved in cell wall biosynthesis